MDHFKHFFVFLALWISASVYWAYYFSNIANIKTEVAVSEAELKKEQQLFEKYRINEEIETWSWNEELNEKAEIFKKESPELKFLRSSFDKSENLKPGEKIIISFEEEIDIYSLLWFKKIENWEFSCNWETKKSEKKAERCTPENKIFITKKWEKNTIFKWVVKKSEVDKKTIIISTNLEELQGYELKISEWVKWFNWLEWVFAITKEDLIFNFSTTDKEWNIKTEEKIEETWTWELAETSSWEVLEVEKETEEKKQKEMEDWLKKKEEEVWKQETEWLEKASEAWLLEVEKEELDSETWTWEEADWENPETWTWEEISWKASETWTWEEADWEILETWTWDQIESEEKLEN